MYRPTAAFKFIGFASFCLAVDLTVAQDLQSYAFVDANVVSMASNEILIDQTVLVSAGRIAATGNADDIAIPINAIVITRVRLPGVKPKADGAQRNFHLDSPVRCLRSKT